MKNKIIPTILVTFFAVIFCKSIMMIYCNRNHYDTQTCIFKLQLHRIDNTETIKSYQYFCNENYFHTSIYRNAYVLYDTRNEEYNTPIEYGIIDFKILSIDTIKIK